MRLHYLDSGQTGRTSRINAVAWAREFEKVVDATRTKCTTASWNEVGADLLRRIDFTVVIAGLAVKCPRAMQVRRSSAIRHITCREASAFGKPLPLFFFVAFILHKYDGR